MMTGCRLTVTAVTAVCLLAGPPLSASSPQPLPAVSLHQADGSTVRLEDFKGKVVLVDFWASWCVPCRASFPALDALYQRDRPRGLEVFAVNVDEQRKAADAFLAGRPHVMPVLFDPKGESAQAFNIRGMPSSVLIDRTSHIRFTHMGYSTTVFDSYQREIDLLLAERP
jgi:thiol-disulfide isomerase/thioredoxin